MSKKDNYEFRNHPKSPCAQPFQMVGNKTSKKGWWRNKK